MKKILSGVVMLVAVMILPQLAQAAVLDVTTLGSSGYLGDAFFQQLDVTNAGSGNLDPFVRLQSNDAVEKGYNTSGRPLQYDENNSPTFTHDVQLGDIPVTTINNILYYEFLLDTNEPNADKDPNVPLLSLDVVHLYVNSVGGMTSPTPGTLVFNLDASEDNLVKMNADLSSGSGVGDMAMYIPTSLFSGYGSSTYLYLCSEFGSNYQNDGGFEEWGVRTGGSTQPPPNVIPEPASMALLGLGLFGAVASRRKRG